MSLFPYFSIIIFLVSSNFINSVVNEDEQTNQQNFIINVGSLNKIFHRGVDEYCDEERIYGGSIQSLEMLHYTIKEINSNKSFLPGVRLILNSTADCVVDVLAIQQIIMFYFPNLEILTSNNTLWGVIGPQSSEVAVPTAKLLGLFKLPQISYGATSPMLSNKQRYSYFFRTAPSDNYQIDAIIELLVKNQWEYVSFIYDDDDYGIGAYDTFLTKTIRLPICLSLALKFPRFISQKNVREFVWYLIENEKSNVIIMFVNQVHFSLLLEQFVKRDTKERFQIIGSDLLHGIQVPDILELLKRDDKEEEFQIVLNGAITFGPCTHLHNDKFKKHLQSLTIGDALQYNPYFALYISYLRNCTLNTTEASTTSKQLCSLDLTLPKETPLTSLLQPARNAITAFANAISDAQMDLCPKNNPLCKEFSRLSGKTLHGYLKNVSFKTSSEQIFSFDSYQDGPAVYDVQMYDGMREQNWKPIGYYKDNELTIEKPLEMFGIIRRKIVSVCGKPCNDDEYMLYQEEEKCCWQCVQCQENSIVKYNHSGTRNSSFCFFCGDKKFASNGVCLPVGLKYLSFTQPWAWTVTIFCNIGLILTLFTCAIFIKSWNSPIVRASGRELSSIMLVGLLLAFTSSYFFTFQPNKSLCSLRRLSAGFCFTLIYASLLVKTIRISIIFNSFGKRMIRDMKTFLKPLPLAVITMLVTAVELFILAVWLIMLPAQTVRVKAARKESHYDFVDCKELRSSMFFIILGYPIFLVLVTAVWAIKIRKVPAGFNEAKHIVFAVYITLVIWLAQVSTFIANTQTDIILRDAIYCMGLSLNGLIILFAIFGPKVYIIMFRPAKNNQSAVMAIPARNSLGSFSTQQIQPVSSEVEKDSIKDVVKKRKTYTTAVNNLRSLYFDIKINLHKETTQRDTQINNSSNKLSGVDYDVCFDGSYADNVFEDRRPSDYKTDVCELSTKSFTKKGIDNKVFYEQ